MNRRAVSILLPTIITASFLIASCSGGGGRTSYRYRASNKWTIKRVERVHVPSSDIKLEVNDKVRAWLSYFTGPGRERFGRYLQRSGRYETLMKQILREHKLPEDIFYIALIESGFTASAKSHANAVGFWQFIRSTGRNYGLKADPYIDERMDFEKSTHAAANHMRDLYNEFGDWYLAFAAYNSGAGKVKRGISKYGTRDFWKLTARKRGHFRPETKDYVPKFIAAAIIAKEPEKYGFRIDYHQPVEFEYANVSSQADLEAIAKCSRADYPTIATLNPELVMGITPPGERNYQVRIPKGMAKRFYKAFAKLPKSERLTRQVAVSKPKYHRVKRGETLDRIARKYGITVGSLKEANRIKNARHLKAGKKLKIPDSSASTLLSANEKGPQDTATPAPRNPGTPEPRNTGTPELRNPGTQTPDAGVTYTVRKGDTLYAIATRNGITVTELCRINNISRRATLKPGRILKVGAPSVGDVQQSTASDRMLLSSAAPPPADSEKVVTYKVRKGDTAWGIARKHKVSINDIENWNSGKDLKKIKPGDIIRLKLAKEDNV